MTIEELKKQVEDMRLDVIETQAEYDDLCRRDAFEHPVDREIYEEMIVEKTLLHAKHDLALREVLRRLGKS